MYIHHFVIASIHHDFQKTILISLIIGLLILISGVIGFVLMTRVISRQIVNLRNGALEASQGNLDVKIETNSTDEVGDLTNAFNKMIGNISESNIALVEEKRLVENKIEMAVKDSEEKKEDLTKNVEKILNELNKI